MDVQDIRDYIFVLSGKNNIKNLVLVCKLWTKSFEPDSLIWTEYVRHFYHDEVFNHKPKDITYHQQIVDLFRTEHLNFDPSVEKSLGSYYNYRPIYDYIERLDIVIHKYYSNPEQLYDILIQSCIENCIDNIRYFDNLDFGGAIIAYDLETQEAYGDYSFFMLIMASMRDNAIEVIKELYAIFKKKTRSTDIFLPHPDWEIYGNYFGTICGIIEPKIYDLLVEMGLQHDTIIAEIAAASDNIPLLNHLITVENFDVSQLDLYYICETGATETLEWLEKFGIYPNSGHLRAGFGDLRFEQWACKKGYVIRDPGRGFLFEF